MSTIKDVTAKNNNNNKKENRNNNNKTMKGNKY